MPARVSLQNGSEDVFLSELRYDFTRFGQRWSVGLGRRLRERRATRSGRASSPGSPAGSSSTWTGSTAERFLTSTTA